MPREYEKLERADLEEVLKVNAKAIEISNEISGQYEELLTQTTEHSRQLTEISKNLDDSAVEIKEIHTEIRSEIKDIRKSQDKIILLLSSGVVGLIIQILTMLWKH